MTEHWKTISEAPRYKISDFGNIYSLINDIPKKSFPDKKGYMRVQLYKSGGIKITRKVHRLVAQHFIKNYNDLPQVNHKDGNKKNNNVRNLEWITNEGNMKHAVNSRYLVKRKDIIDLLPQIVTAINNGYVINDIAKLYNITASYITTLINKYDVEPKPIVDLIVGRKKNYVYFDKSRNRWRTELRSFGLKNKQFLTREEALLYIENIV